jgi:sec-independent protein translocase protein TatB
MFDIGPTELLLIVVVAVIVIGPKDLPLALRTAGRWIGRVRKVSGQFRAGFDAMVREAEMQELEEKWKAQNEKIMREHPNGGPPGTEQTGAYPAAPPPPPASAEANAAISDEYRDGPVADGVPVSTYAE